MSIPPRSDSGVPASFVTTVRVVARPRRWATCRPTAPGATALRPPGPSADAPRDLHPFHCFYAAVQLHKCAQVVCLLADQAGDISMAARVSPLPSSGGAAFHRRERRLRSFWKHEQYSIKMALACATHRSWQRRASVGVQTDATPAPVAEYGAPTPLVEHITLDPVVY